MPSMGLKVIQSVTETDVKMVFEPKQWPKHQHQDPAIDFTALQDRVVEERLFSGTLKTCQCRGNAALCVDEVCQAVQNFAKTMLD